MPEDLETSWESVQRELRPDLTDFAFHVWIDPLRPRARSGTTLFVDAPGHMRTLVGERYLAKLDAAAVRALGPGAQIELVDESFTGPPTSRADPGCPQSSDDRLNPKYTFAQFVIGEGNRLAHAAALAVAELPAQAYNPLFIHGRPGLGKTHLLHAIGNYVHRHGSALTVRYTTVESFTGAFVEALRRHEASVFKERFRGADVLLIDDVQFLADKTRTKEEFFHTFNALYESGRQLVLTSDRSPDDMSDFEARLTERFACGLVAELEPPGFEVRLAILRKRARCDQLSGVGDNTLAEIATHVRSSVRALEGALIRVVAFASLRNAPTSPELARELLGRLCAASPRERPSVRDVQEATAAELGVALEDLLARDRRPSIAFARQVAMYLARELTGGSLPAIGRNFGGRNHATVLHAHRKMAQQITGDGETKRAVQRVTNRLQEGG